MKEEDAAGTTLLLVEDDHRIRQALRLALADEGYEVREAATGSQALVQIGVRTVDVVLLEVMLPDMDGLEVCHRLRAESDLPIIVVSALTRPSDIIAGLEAGADDYMTKPLVAAELSARIRALLRRARSAQGTSAADHDGQRVRGPGPPPRRDVTGRGGRPRPAHRRAEPVRPTRARSSGDLPRGPGRRRRIGAPRPRQARPPRSPGDRVKPTSLGRRRQPFRRGRQTRPWRGSAQVADRSAALGPTHAEAGRGSRRSGCRSRRRQVVRLGVVSALGVRTRRLPAVDPVPILPQGAPSVPSAGLTIS